MPIDNSPKPKYVRVQLVLDEETNRMVDELVEIHSTEDREHNRSSIVRRAIRLDYRHALRKLAQQDSPTKKNVVGELPEAV